MDGVVGYKMADYMRILIVRRQRLATGGTGPSLLAIARFSAVLPAKARKQLAQSCVQEGRPSPLPSRVVSSDPQYPVKVDH